MGALQAMLTEFKLDYNQRHFVRNATFAKAAESIQGPARKVGCSSIWSIKSELEAHTMILRAPESPVGLPISSGRYRVVSCLKFRL